MSSPALSEDQGPKVWADIRDGRIARRDLTLRRPPSSQPAADLLPKLTEELIERTGADQQGLWVLAAYPSEDITLDDFYSNDGIHGSLQRLRQTSIRRSGFGLGYGQDIEMIGDGLAVVEPARRSLCVDPSGLAIAIALGSEEMLGWADRNSQQQGRPMRINPYVITECPPCFASEFAALRSSDPDAPRTGSTWRYSTQATRLSTGRPAVTLALGPGSLYERGPRVDGAGHDLNVTDPEVDAYKLEAWFVGLFGYKGTDLPWAQDYRIPSDTIRGWK